jgi:glycosyltransferase involved in cell wall biosynthesis
MRRETTHPELTILMPCLNEAETIATCVKKASSYLSKSNIRGEILVADNGSTDSSREIAQGLGARFVSICERGYGSRSGSKLSTIFGSTNSTDQDRRWDI